MQGKRIMMDKKNGIWAIALIAILLLPSLAFAEEELTGSYGIVNSSYLNVRSGDGIKFASLGILDGGTRLEILGRNLDSSWYLVSDGEMSGWARSAHVVLRGMSARVYPVIARANFAPLAPNIALVNTSYLNLREGAGMDYEIIQALPGGTSTELIGHNADWSWVYVELEDGTVGWLKTSRVLLRGETVSSTVERLEDGNLASVNHGIVNTPFLNMRSGDGIQYAVQEILSDGTLLYVLGHNANGNWLYARVRDREGWVHSNYVVLRGDSMDTYPLTVAAQNAPMVETMAIVNTPFLNIRSGDHFSTEVLGVLPGGSELNVLATNESGSWFMVETTEGQLGWVSAAYVVLRGPHPSVVTLG